MCLQSSPRLAMRRRPKPRPRSKRLGTMTTKNFPLRMIVRCMIDSRIVLSVAPNPSRPFPECDLRLATPSCLPTIQSGISGVVSACRVLMQEASDRPISDNHACLDHVVPHHVPGSLRTCVLVRRVLWELWKPHESYGSRVSATDPPTWQCLIKMHKRSNRRLKRHVENGLLTSRDVGRGCGPEDIGHRLHSPAHRQGGRQGRLAQGVVRIK